MAPHGHVGQIVAVADVGGCRSTPACGDSLAGAQTGAVIAVVDGHVSLLHPLQLSAARPMILSNSIKYTPKKTIKWLRCTICVIKNCMND